MREIPECLNRRYQALDELIKELTMATSRSEESYPGDAENDAGVKLMCDFWNILQEEPDFNLTQAVRQRMGLQPNVSKTHHPQPQRVTCYMACGHDDKRDSKTKHVCGEKGQKSPESPTPSGRTCCSKAASPRPSAKNSDTLPLSKVLCNLKEAVSFDKKCNIRIGELLLAEKQLQEQIQHLEHREKEGMQMLKQADCMWSCMEEAYKKKVQESQERQNALLKQLKEVEASNTKWRKNKKDLEFQCDNINKCYLEIMEKMHEKQNDIKCIKMEIENLKKRINSNKKDTETVKKSFGTKKQASDKKIASLSAEMTRIQKLVDEEKYHKNEKEEEGAAYVQEARNDLKKICRVLLQKRLENEDMRAEKEAVIQEIELLKQTWEQCKEKCQNKQQTIIDEIANLDGEIANFTVRCIRCHECTDTGDTRKFCTDCPRCLAERECMYEDDHCMLDKDQDCVCMVTKQRFLDNVFDNMYTVLERQTKTCPGKAVAQAVLDCLKRSRNGKLNSETRKILQDFVLTTVKKNLNLTIIGGAVKTRCEMDPETYKQLMLCLKEVKTVKHPKADKGTDSKKDPCRRWGGTSECNCPKGPKSCICTRKAPRPPNDPEPCPPEVDKEDAAEVTVCPHKDSVPCGADCGLHSVPSVGAEVASWRPAPCDEKQCQFSKNMRAAQCVLGPDALSSISKSKGLMSSAPCMPDIIERDEQIQCTCGPTVTKPCVCRKDEKRLKAKIDKCDQETCSRLWEQATKSTLTVKEEKKDVRKKDSFPTNRNSLFSKEVKDSESNKSQQKVITRQPNAQGKKYLPKHMPIENKKPCIENKNVKFDTPSTPNSQKKCVCDDHFKLSLDSDNSQFTKLSDTPSGSLAMELDEEIIKKIEQRMKGDSLLEVSLTRTASGHRDVDFNPISSINKQIINVNRSPSGALVFEVEKNFVDILRPEVDIDSTKLKLDSKSSIPVLITPKKYLKNINQTIKNKIERIDSEVLEQVKSHIYENQQLKSDEILNNSDKNTLKSEHIKVKESNRAFILIKVEKTRTESGNRAYVITDISNLGIIGEVVGRCHEYPVQLSKSPSGFDLLDVRSVTPNAIIRKTRSGKILIVKVDSVQKCNETNSRSCFNKTDKSNKDLYKVTIKDQKKLGTLPIVLKQTPSENYVAVIDKEYEKHYKETVMDNIHPDCKYPVELVKTKSENYILNMDEDELNKNANAFLVRSLSGNVKIIPNSSDKSNNPVISRKDSIKVLESLIHDLPVCDELEKPVTTRPRLLESKSSSDSNLYEKVRLRLQNQHSLLSEPSALLRKTSSGQYAVVLNKESKRTFIKDLKTYLANNSQGLIPIKRSDSGEITIILNSDNDSKGNYGSLKITPSGNIYVLIDEKVIKSIVKNGKIEHPHRRREDSGSKCEIQSIQNPSNKVVTTTCNALPDSCSCDPSKCVCAELLKHGVNDSYFESRSAKCNVKYCQSNEGCRSECKHKCDCGIPENCDTMFCDEKTPHVFIKPCSCRSKEESNCKDDYKPMYYVTESVCPFHKDRYDSVSNELIEISGLCHKANQDKLKVEENDLESPKPDFKAYFEPSSLDYLDYLPPQLPHFLRDFTCV